MGNYFRTPAMHGEKPFFCHNCGKKMAVSLTGSNYAISLSCPRCKCKMHVECNEAIPFLLKDGEPVEVG